MGVRFSAIATVRDLDNQNITDSELGTRVERGSGVDVAEAQCEVLARDLDAPVLDRHEHEAPICLAKMAPRSRRSGVDHYVLFKARQPGILDRCHDKALLA